VALEPGLHPTLVFVEVRSATSDRFGAPEESIDRRKLLCLYRAGRALGARGRFPDGTPLPRVPWRVDLVTVDLWPTVGPTTGGPVLRHLRSVMQ
jgi:Holliday junction resolvase-like predicted endonuclease